MRELTQTVDITQAGSDGPNHHIFHYYGESLFSWVEDNLETIYFLCLLCASTLLEKCCHCE